MSDIERQCKFLRELFKDIDVDGGKLQLKLENCAISLEKQESELSQLRQLCLQQHEAFSALLKYLDDHDWCFIPEGETADKARAAIEKYQKVIGS